MVLRLQVKSTPHFIPQIMYFNCEQAKRYFKNLRSPKWIEKQSIYGIAQMRTGKLHKMIPYENFTCKRSTLQETKAICIYQKKQSLIHPYELY